MNDKRQAFVAEYLIDMNATQAAARAGYSAQSARQQGQRLLSNASIKAAIAKAQMKRAQKTGVTAAWVLKRLQEEASAGDTDTPNQARIRALELLGKHQRMFADRVECDLSRLTADELRAAEELRRKMEGPPAPSRGGGGQTSGKHGASRRGRPSGWGNGPGSPPPPFSPRAYESD